MLETLRMSSFAPTGIPHVLLEDVQYEEFYLPKDLILIPNIYHANHNVNVWGDPENFRPDRFLEGTETERKRLRDSVASFQEGKRRCVGEQMAKDNLFLFAARLFQKYSFYPENGKNIAEFLKPIEGFVLMPPKFGVRIVR